VIWTAARWIVCASAGCLIGYAIKVGGGAAWVQVAAGLSVGSGLNLILRIVGSGFHRASRVVAEVEVESLALLSGLRDPVDNDPFAPPPDPFDDAVGLLRLLRRKRRADERAKRGRHAEVKR
jgi:hypothetical protein